MVDKIYFCELSCEQLNSSIDSELWAVTPAIHSWAVNNEFSKVFWAVNNKFSKDLSCEQQTADQHRHQWLFSPISSISSEQKPLKLRLTSPTSSGLMSENKKKYAQWIYLSKNLKICFLASKFRKKKAKIYSSSPGQNFGKKICSFLDNNLIYQKIKKRRTRCNSKLTFDPYWAQIWTSQTDATPLKTASLMNDFLKAKEWKKNSIYFFKL